MSDYVEQKWPGEELGLPEKGPGSLAPWSRRIVAIVLDWAISMVLAFAIFGPEGVRGTGWHTFIILGIFFLESTLLTWLAGGSAGKLLTRIGIIRLDRQPVGLLRSMIRAALMCLAFPALVIGANRRPLTDLTLGTVVVNRL